MTLIGVPSTLICQRMQKHVPFLLPATTEIAQTRKLFSMSAVKITEMLLIRNNFQVQLLMVGGLP